MSVILSGGDNPTWRQMLVEVQATAIAFDAAGILRRKGEVYDIAEKVPDGIEVWIDGSVRDGDPDAALAFWAVVEHNIKRVTKVIEYGGVDAAARERLRMSQPPAVRAKTIPLWQPGDGAEALEALATSHNTIAVPRAALRNRRGPGARLSGLRMQGARVVLTGAGLSDIGTDTADVIITASWTTPRRYGEAVVGDGTRLHRVPIADVEYTPEVLEQAAVEDGWRDDLDTLCRLAAVEVMRATPVGPRPSSAHPAVLGEEVDIDRVFRPTTVLPTIRRESTELPVVNQTRQLMVCNRCTLSTMCPEATPNAECAFEIPAELKSHDDVRRMQTIILELQAKRVMWNVFAEQIRGGERDDGVGTEMDRWMRMLKIVREINDDSSFTDLRIRTRGEGGGTLAAIFGGDAQVMTELDEPIDANAVAEHITSN